MSTPEKSGKRKSCFLVTLVASLAALVIVFAVAGFAFAATQETRDAFCASCHTQPETTYYERSTSGSPVDLASFHTAQKTRCIDCHSGGGVPGRIQAELMGAQNAAKWYTGTAVQPAVLTYAIKDPNCLKCHQDVVQRDYIPKEQITILGGNFGEEEGGRRAGHWHTFMTRWQAASSTAGTCVTCHSGHTTGSSAQNGFMDEQAVRSTCEACHRAIGEGEGE